MKLFISDIKYITGGPVRLAVLLSPIIIILLLLFICPVLSDMTSSGGAFPCGRFYSLTGITLISSIPLIYGLLFSFIHLNNLNDSNNNGTQKSPEEARKNLIIRTAITSFLSFIIVLPVICITDPVLTEGWLRSIYAAFLMAVLGSFVFLFTVGFAREIKNWRGISLISVLFLITVPSGLLFHHPWNYFLFFSPFYWSGWAWVIQSPAESMLYGIISLVISTLGMLVSYRYLVRKSENI